MKLNELYDFITDKALVNKWGRYLEAVSEAYGGKVKPETLYSIARLMENTEQAIEASKSRLLESPTQATAIGPFKRYAFELIPAIMPQIIANEIVSVQPLKQKIGQIFFLQVNYGSSKGAIQQGTAMFSPWQVSNVPTDPNYSSEFVNGEVLGLASSSGSYSGNFAWTPIRSGTIVITATTSSGTVTVVDDGNGNLIQQGATPVTIGTVNYQNGAFTLAFGTAVTSNVTANYRYNLEVAPTTIPEVNVEVLEYIITAMSRKLRANYAFDAAYDLQISQGVNMDDILLKAAASEIRHEIDVEIMNDLLNQAGLNTNFSLIPQQGTTVSDWLNTAFTYAINSASDMIFQNTRRAFGNFIIVGKQGADLFRTMGSDRFEPSGITDPKGPFFLGTFNGSMKVYFNPYYPMNKFLVGYRGEELFDAGYVYAPYLPLFSTQVIMLDDFIGRRGFATSYGKKMLNNIFYVHGDMIGSAPFPQ